MMKKHKCLFCGAELTHIFADLGTCPPSNAFLTAEQCNQPEIYYPLRTYICEQCLLVQGPLFKRPQEIFNYNYVYHSSWSRSWVEHAKAYVHQQVQRFSLGPNSLIIELGSNDGYLLQHAVALGIPCLGIDPSSGATTLAQLKGVPTITDFFTLELAQMLKERHKLADLICGINVFAHVPNINNFISGMETLLKPNGVVTMEFPHLLKLVQNVQFDTIYHEHYFYYNLTCVQNMLEKHHLRLFDVEELPTHGGSLRIYACREQTSYTCTERIKRILEEEKNAGMDKINFYLGFQEKIGKIRRQFIRFLMELKEANKTIAGYGAAAKGNTLLNYFGVKKDLLPFVADTSPIKQGLFLPGSHIPVLNEEAIMDAKPDYILILPWNLKEEISDQLSYVRNWGGKFVTTIPEIHIF